VEGRSLLTIREGEDLSKHKTLKGRGEERRQVDEIEAEGLNLSGNTLMGGKTGGEKRTD